MKDLYSFHLHNEDLDKYYNEIIIAYQKIFTRLGIGPETLLTYASGGSFSKYSHEFQTICETGEDTVHICEKCNVAVNQELIEELVVCPECGNKELVEKKAIETGNIFKLGTKYSSAFNFKYSDKEGKLQDIIMGCYGIGPSRIMGTLVEVFHDDLGIIWPSSVSPYKFHLIGLDPKAEEFYHLLNENDVLFDDRDGVSAGAKFATADLIGIPIRLVVSAKSLESGGIEVKERNDTNFSIMSFDDVILKYGKTR
jgi:prolyl-tRNA synthetase